jgi:hypothetical protein
MERYRLTGQRNRLDGIEVLRVELAKVDLDAYFESITVRIFARMADWTEDAATGLVVAGHKTQRRTSSEYWTFIRAVGAQRRSGDPWDIRGCPSCAAPIEEIQMAGVCGHCNAKISGGAFDWVRSRIEQDEAYRG